MNIYEENVGNSISSCVVDGMRDFICAAIAICVIASLHYSKLKLVTVVNAIWKMNIAMPRENFGTVQMVFLIKNVSQKTNLNMGIPFPLN